MYSPAISKYKEVTSHSRKRVNKIPSIQTKAESSTNTLGGISRIEIGQKNLTVTVPSLVQSRAELYKSQYYNEHQWKLLNNALPINVHTRNNTSSKNRSTQIFIPKTKILVEDNHKKKQYRSTHNKYDKEKVKINYEPDFYVRTENARTPIMMHELKPSVFDSKFPTTVTFREIPNLLPIPINRIPADDRFPMNINSLINELANNYNKPEIRGTKDEELYIKKVDYEMINELIVVLPKLFEYGSGRPKEISIEDYIESYLANNVDKEQLQKFMKKAKDSRMSIKEVKEVLLSLNVIDKDTIKWHMIDKLVEESRKDIESTKKVMKEMVIVLEATKRSKKKNIDTDKVIKVLPNSGRNYVEDKDDVRNEEDKKIKRDEKDEEYKKGREDKEYKKGGEDEVKNRGDKKNEEYKNDEDEKRNKDYGKDDEKNYNEENKLVSEKGQIDIGVNNIDQNEEESKRKEIIIPEVKDNTLDIATEEASLVDKELKDETDRDNIKEGYKSEEINVIKENDKEENYEEDNDQIENLSNKRKKHKKRTHKKAVKLKVKKPPYKSKEELDEDIKEEQVKSEENEVVLKEHNERELEKNHVVPIIKQKKNIIVIKSALSTGGQEEESKNKLGDIQEVLEGSIDEDSSFKYITPIKFNNELPPQEIPKPKPINSPIKDKKKTKRSPKFNELARKSTELRLASEDIPITSRPKEQHSFKQFMEILTEEKIEEVPVDKEKERFRNLTIREDLEILKDRNNPQKAIDLINVRMGEPRRLDELISRLVASDNFKNLILQEHPDTHDASYNCKEELSKFLGRFPNFNIGKAEARRTIYEQNLLDDDSYEDAIVAEIAEKLRIRRMKLRNSLMNINPRVKSLQEILEELFGNKLKYLMMQDMTTKEKVNLINAHLLVAENVLLSRQEKQKDLLLLHSEYEKNKNERTEGKKANRNSDLKKKKVEPKKYKVDIDLLERLEQEKLIHPNKP